MVSKLYLINILILISIASTQLVFPNQENNQQDIDQQQENNQNLPEQRQKQQKKSFTPYGSVQFNFYYLSASKRHNANGDNENIGSFKEFTFNIFTDIWINPRINLFLSFNSLKHITAKSDSSIPNSPSKDNSETNIGDLNIGFKYAIIPRTNNKFINLDYGLIIGIPTGRSTSGQGTTIGGSNYTLPTGNGDFNFTIFEQFMMKFGVFYIFGDLGFNFRTNNNSFEYYIANYLGIKLFKEILSLDLGIKWLDGLNNGNRTNTSLALTHANNPEYLLLNPKLSVQINSISLQLGIFLGLIAKNTPSTTVLHFGVAYLY